MLWKGLVVLGITVLSAFEMPDSSRDYRLKCLVVLGIIALSALETPGSSRNNDLKAVGRVKLTTSGNIPCVYFRQN